MLVTVENTVLTYPKLIHVETFSMPNAPLQIPLLSPAE